VKAFLSFQKDAPHGRYATHAREEISKKFHEILELQLSRHAAIACCFKSNGNGGSWQYSTVPGWRKGIDKSTLCIQKRQTG
jgi:hypothetical protein